jgi:nitronate monooxygenase
VQTSFTSLVGCRHPLQQAAMGGVATPELASAVARAGALGMLCEFAPEPSAARIARTLELAAGGPAGMGFFGHRVSGDLETFELAAARLRVVEVFWTTPDPDLVARAKRAGDALVAWQIGSVEDAVLAQDAGCDVVIAQGVEAGGHVRGTTARMKLLAAVLERVTLPVVSAGGIATAEDVRIVLDAGAAAARVGTRFVATRESSAHPAYIDALVDAREGDTVLTTAFGVGWPDAPHRVLRSALEAATKHADDVVGRIRIGDVVEPLPRFNVSTPSVDVEGDVEAMALYAGEGVGHVRGVSSAEDVVNELVAGLD